MINEYNQIDNYFRSNYAYDFSQLEMRKVVGDVINKKLNKSVFGVNPCPLCGHSGCFKFIPETQLFKCFSTECQKTGGVLQFVMYYNNWSARETGGYLIQTYFKNKKEKEDVYVSF